MTERTLVELFSLSFRYRLCGSRNSVMNSIAGPNKRMALAEFPIEWEYRCSFEETWTVSEWLAGCLECSCPSRGCGFESHAVRSKSTFVAPGGDFRATSRRACYYALALIRCSLLRARLLRAKSAKARNANSRSIYVGPLKGESSLLSTRGYS